MNLIKWGVEVVLKVITVDEMMKVGSTIPLRVTCSDSHQYILKGINNYVETGKALFNEVVGSRFAALIQLDTPQINIGNLSDEVINDSIDLKKYGFKPGPCFLSRYMEGTSLKVSPVTAKYISNIEIVPKLIVFDAVLMNSDRNGNSGNWFNLKQERKLIAIDHSNIFRLAQIWDKNSLQQDEKIPPEIIDEIKGKDYQTLIDEYKKRKYRKYEHKRQHQHPFSTVGRTIKHLSGIEIENCFADIPPEWSVSKEDQEAAKKFLEFQINHIDDIIHELEQLFKV